MAVEIPLARSVSRYTFDTVLEGTSYVFDVHWNSTDNDGAGAWYFDVYELSGQLIAAGIKIVLGTWVGRQYRYRHKLFSEGAFIAIDTSNANLDAGFDDIGPGQRVMFSYHNKNDLINTLYGSTT